MRQPQPLRYLRKPGSANRVGPRENDAAKTSTSPSRIIECSVWPVQIGVRSGVVVVKHFAASRRCKCIELQRGTLVESADAG